MFGIDPSEYMLSLCGDTALRELSSPGKSGSMFYLSHDDRFFIKTMRRAEVQVRGGGGEGGGPPGSWGVFSECVCWMAVLEP